MTSKTKCLAALVLALLVSPSPATPQQPISWTNLAQGLDFGRFPTGRAGFGGDGTVAVLRADPGQWSLEVMSTSARENVDNLTTRQWCEQEGLTAAINAGMFDVDYRTHVGLCATAEHANNPVANHYQSVAAFAPRDCAVAPFRIFDLDEPGVSLDKIRQDYGEVVQNLRLIKRPGENRWSPQPKRWSEVALGEDAQGRILFIFCRTGYSMHEFNEILRELPLDLVCAQHLEGGPEAQLFVDTGGFTRELSGSYETGFNENDDSGWVSPLPVVLGLRARRP